MVDVEPGHITPIGPAQGETYGFCCVFAMLASVGGRTPRDFVFPDPSLEGWLESAQCCQRRGLDY